MPQPHPLLGAGIYLPEPASLLGKLGLMVGQGEGQREERVPAQPPKMLPLPLGQAPSLWTTRQ